MAETKYPIGKNPNSLKNLEAGYGGKPRGFDSEEKKRRSLSVTETGWQGTQSAIKKYGCKSVSEFLEKFGRGQFDLGNEKIDLSA